MPRKKGVPSLSADGKFENGVASPTLFSLSLFVAGVFTGGDVAMVLPSFECLLVYRSIFPIDGLLLAILLVLREKRSFFGVRDDFKNLVTIRIIRSLIVYTFIGMSQVYPKTPTLTKNY